MNVEHEFRFSPRPAAHEMKWKDLLPPVRCAVEDLLVRLDGAVGKGDKDNIATANCFLVYGDRGTGKTTVLLSAKYACESKNEFFSKAPNDDVCNQAKASASAEQLKDVVWLDVLDLEPLPPRANLLTTLLTRIRNACYDDAASDEPHTEATSILDGSAERARYQLGQLIKDATLMWEDIEEADTRSRANRQIAAADIYARFQKDFREAIDDLSRLLGRQNRRADGHRSIVLPVDNIDRSTEHLYSMVKLAQMVACPQLWLVMAGDRQDVETFLERAYWKELIRVGEGAGAVGKTGPGGEDEALVMARRQAAAASHTLLPPSHRVEVHLAKPKDTLDFKPPSESGQSEPDKSIRELLAKVRLVTGKENKEDEEDLSEITLIDLFDAASRIRNVVDPNNKDKEKSYLTEAAQLGLRLPARGVLDLWQLASWVTSNYAKEPQYQAEKIARTMLRNVISESSMPSEMGRRLQEQIIRRTHQGGTILDFEDPNLQTLNHGSSLDVTRLQSLDFELETVPFGPNKPFAMRSTLAVMQVKRLSLRLKCFPQGVQIRCCQQAQQRGVSNGNVHTDQSHRTTVHNKSFDTNADLAIEKILLPDLVAAWLTILHDTLVWGAEDSDTIGLDGSELRPSAIVTCVHKTVIEKLIEVGIPDPIQEPTRYAAKIKNAWPIPAWRTFDMHNVFWELWCTSLFVFKKTKLLDRAAKLRDQAAMTRSALRLLVATWVACVLETFLSYANLPKNGDDHRVWAELRKAISTEEGEEKLIQDAEIKVMLAASKVYEEILGVSHRGVKREEEIRRHMKYWLEWELPSLLSYSFVPVTPDKEPIDNMNNTRAAGILNDEKFIGTDLAVFWRERSVYILANIDREIMRQIGVTSEELKQAPPPFNDLNNGFSDKKGVS